MNKNQIGISNSPSFQNNKNVERSLEKIDVLLNKLNQTKKLREKYSQREKNMIWGRD